MMRLAKADLIGRVAGIGGTTRKSAATIIDLVFACVAEAVAAGT